MVLFLCLSFFYYSVVLGIELKGLCTELCPQTFLFIYTEVKSCQVVQLSKRSMVPASRGAGRASMHHHTQLRNLYLHLNYCPCAPWKRTSMLVVFYSLPFGGKNAKIISKTHVTYSKLVFL